MAGEYKEQEAKMKKTLEVLRQEFSTLRAGRANPAVLDRITIDYYGTQTPINQVASISSPEPRLLAIQPWDASVLKAIEKAILASDIGINPQNDGRVIRLLFPTLTEERRRELVKQRDAMDIFKAQKKKSEITEDDYADIEKDIQALTDRYIKDVDTLGAAKEKELIEV